MRNFNVKYLQEKFVVNPEMNFSQNYNKFKESQTNEKDDCDAASELSYWQATTCHEVGHCLAMTHSNITGEIMYQDLETELENGSSIISPSYGDFQKLSVLYG